MEEEQNVLETWGWGSVNYLQVLNLWDRLTESKLKGYKKGQNENAYVHLLSFRVYLIEFNCTDSG